MDKTSNWFWYEEEPKDEDGYFTTTGKVAQFSHLPYPGHWRLSPQHRPAREEFFFSFAEFAYAYLQP